MALLPYFTNFTDMSVKEDPCVTYPGYFANGSVKCPVCSGYGGSVLQVDAYGKGKHFKCFCSQCNGWGWVEKGSQDASCAHEWDTSKGIGNCLHLWVCTKCGQSREVDSSG
jgi:hypothetical protein